MQPRNIRIVKHEVARFSAADGKRTISGQLEHLGMAVCVMDDDSWHLGLPLSSYKKNVRTTCRQRRGFVQTKNST
jgi:hypothetical protein